jgi:sarcosine oxidase subunit gamma
LLLSGAPDDAAAIEAALSDEAHSLVDISHRNAAFAVSGGRAREVLNGGCPLDLDDRAFPAGMGTRTLFGKAEVVLLCSGSPSGFRLECARSFAPYVAALLELNAREFAGN